jgi:hypothetical protein
MTIQMLEQISTPRRNALFNAITRIVDQASAIDRSLERLDEGLAVDDSLEEIVETINDEARLARKSRRLRANILKMADADNAA